MTAPRQDPLVEVWADEPVPFVLTDLGVWATTGWVDTEEAAKLLQLPRESVAALASRGQVVGRKVGHQWLLSRAGVEVYLRDRRGRGRGRRTTVRQPRERRRPVRVPSGPLERLVAARGGLRACGAVPGSAAEAAFYRARREGSITVGAADRLAVRLLGLTPWEVWAE